MSTTSHKLPMRWRAAMAAVVMIGVARGLSYFPPLITPDRVAPHALEALLPPQVWGGVWIATCVVLVVSTRWHRITPAAVGIIVALHTAWGMSFLYETLFHGNARAWVSALNYLLVAMLVFLVFSERPALSLTIRR